MISKLKGKGAAKSFVKKTHGCPKKSIAIFGYKQSLLSIHMKTKVVQHVPRIILNVLPFSPFSNSGIPASQRPSDFQTFFYLAFLPITNELSVHENKSC